MRSVSACVGRYAIVAGISLALPLGLAACEGTTSSASGDAASAASTSATAGDAGQDGATSSEASQSATSSGSGSATSAAAPVQDDELLAQLSALDGVVDARRLDGDFQFFTAKYLLALEQPLDWKDPSAGSFTQRVTVGVVATPAATVIHTNGGPIDDAEMGADDANDLARTIQANYVNVERRLSGESRPEGLSDGEADGWQYLTPEQAANDLHHVYEVLAPVFEGRWAATGSSQSGALCVTYAYYHPEDMDFSVPYDSPWSEGPADDRLYPWLDMQTDGEQGGGDQDGAGKADEGQARDGQRGEEQAGEGQVSEERDDTGQAGEERRVEEQAGKEQVALSYDDGFARELRTWWDSTECKIVAIYGAGSPGFDMRPPTTENPNVRVFVIDQVTDAAKIADLSESDREELQTLLRIWLGLGVGGKEAHA